MRLAPREMLGAWGALTSKTLTWMETVRSKDETGCVLLTPLTLMVDPRGRFPRLNHLIGAQLQFAKARSKGLQPKGGP